MRIVVLDPSSFSPPYDDRLCAALAATGADVRLFTRPAREHETYTLHGYTVHEHFYRWSERLTRLKYFKPFYRYVKAVEHAFNMYALSSALRRIKPDIIHFQWCPLPVLDAMFLPTLRRIAPIVLTVHNTRPFHGNPSSWLQAVGWKRILDVFDELIVHTEQSRAHLLAAGCRSSRVTVIPHGTLQVSTREAKSRLVSRDMENAGLKKIILFFGNIKPYKGVDVLLKSFARISESKRKNAKIVIAGRSSVPQSELDGLITGLGIEKHVELDLRFLSDEELDTLLEKAYMYIFPYKDIDASGALMLALPFGKPIVASRLGIFSEILVDGVNALLADVNDIRAFALAIERILCDARLAERLGKGAQQLVSQYTSWEDIAQLTTKTYRQLLDASGAPDSVTK